MDDHADLSFAGCTCHFVSFCRVVVNHHSPEAAPYHRRRKVKNIGGPRFRILGGGGRGGGKFPAGTLRRTDVDAM